MAAEMINQILSAESKGKAEENAAQKKADDLIEYTKQKAGEMSDQILATARRKAEAIIEDAEERAGEIADQAANLAKLRKKSVIKETEKKYKDAIETIIDNLV